jgi:hypothetical protein
MNRFVVVEAEPWESFSKMPARMLEPPGKWSLGPQPALSIFRIPMPVEILALIYKTPLSTNRFRQRPNACREIIYKKLHF